jgi:acyl-CoA thioester hydrolase
LVPSLGSARKLTEILLSQIKQYDLVKDILEINEDILGHYIYRWNGAYPKRSSGHIDDEAHFNTSSQIVLYWGVIGLVAMALGVDVADLSVVVLAHEVAHAYTHLGFDIDQYRRGSANFSESDQEVQGGVGASVKVELSVRLDELDYLGIVHTSNYLKYMEHARVKLLEKYDVDLLAWVNKGIRSIVVNDTINYRQPAYYGDLLEITCRVDKVGKSSSTLAYNIVEKKSGKEVLNGSTTMVCIDNEGKPMPIPEEIRAKFGFKSLKT